MKCSGVSHSVILAEKSDRPRRHSLLLRLFKVEKAVVACQMFEVLSFFIGAGLKLL